MGKPTVNRQFLPLSFPCLTYWLFSHRPTSRAVFEAVSRFKLHARSRPAHYHLICSTCQTSNNVKFEVQDERLRRDFTVPSPHRDIYLFPAPSFRNSVRNLAPCIIAASKNHQCQAVYQTPRGPSEAKLSRQPSCQARPVQGRCQGLSNK
jgi:hypothetical protein